MRSRSGRFSRSLIKARARAHTHSVCVGACGWVGSAVDTAGLMVRTKLKKKQCQGAVDKADSLEAVQHKRADDDPIPSAGSQAMGRFRSAIICIHRYHYLQRKPLAVVVVGSRSAVIRRGAAVTRRGRCRI